MVVFLWWCGCVFVVVQLCFCVFAVVFPWWCGCVFVVVWLCLCDYVGCGCVFVVVWLCFNGRVFVVAGWCFFVCF